MKDISLKSIYEGKQVLSEMIEPSEQILKLIMTAFKQASGINLAPNSLILSKNFKDNCIYESDLTKETSKSPLWTMVFDSVKLQVKISEVPNSLANYRVQFDIIFRNVGSKTYNTYTAGILMWENNKIRGIFGIFK